jgi:hypothetical protein
VAVLTLASAKVLESLLDLLFIAVGQLLTAKKRMRLHLLTIENEYAKVLLFEEELIHIFDPSEPWCKTIHDRYQIGQFNESDQVSKLCS